MRRMLTTAPTDSCPDCGKPVPPASPEGLCAHCLALGAAGTLFAQTPTIENLSEHRFFADYELLEELGRGGSGIVFKARQFGVNRIVALKLLSSGPAAGRDFVHRFHTEAAAAAQLEHPNIVPIYEFGEHEGAHFLAMRYLEGGTLQSLIARERPDARDSARLLLIIALAVEHAHRRGILHRDLKPGNILLSSKLSSQTLSQTFSNSSPPFEPYIADFGLARVLEHESSLTLSHSVLGTVAYLSPEVASQGASAATTASDIYGLGAILYELFTGHPPFQKPSIPATLRAIAEETPRLFKSAIRPGAQLHAVTSAQSVIDLETICLKCLEKDPLKRYPTAQALADDLQHFLKNEPITARPITRTAKLVRWSQRNPALAAAYSLLFLLLLLVLLGSPVAIYRINRARKAEASARYHAESAAQAQRAERYTSDMNLVLQAWEQGNLSLARNLLRAQIPVAGESDLRSFEWRYLSQLCRAVSVPLANVDESIWRLATSSGHPYVAAACENNVHLFDPNSGREIGRLPFPNPSAPNSWHLIAVAAGATNVLATHRAGGLICIWDVALSKMISSFRPFTNNAAALALSPNGKLLAAADRQEFYGTQVGVWDIASDPQHPRPLWTNSAELGIPALAFSPDGKQLLLGETSTTERMLELRDATSGALSQTIKDGAPGYIETVAFSPDGSLIAFSGAEARIRIFDLRQKQLKRILDAPGATSLTFSSDGRQLLSSGSDRSIRQWDVATGQLSGTWRETRNGVIPAVFAPNGQSIISAMGNRLNRWSAEPQQLAGTMEVPAGFTWPAISPDGRWLVISGIATADSAIVLDLRTRKRHLALSSKGTLPQTPAFSPDGRFFALGDINIEGLVGLWDTSLWDQPRRTLSPVAYITNSFEAGSLSFSPDGNSLVVAGLSFPPFAPKDPSHATNRLAFWSVPDFKRLDLLSQAGIGDSDWTAAVTARFSPGGQSLAVGYRDGSVRLWEINTGRLLHAWKEHQSTGWGVDLRFSKNGRWLASVALSGASIILFDLADSRRPRTVPITRDDPARPMWLDFAPDSKTLVTGHYDGTINFWNLETFRSALTLHHSGGPGTFLSFSPDGSLLVSKDAQGRMKFWEAASRDPINLISQINIGRNLEDHP
jgi:serine/threonine protein kinase/WD40 repeat protein